MRYLILALPFTLACSSQPLAPSSVLREHTITVRLLEYQTNQPIRTYSQNVQADTESCVSVNEPGYRAMPWFDTVCGTVRSSGETWSFWLVKE